MYSIQSEASSKPDRERSGCDGGFPGRHDPSPADLEGDIQVARAISDEQLCGCLPPTSPGCESEQPPIRSLERP